MNRFNLIDYVGIINVSLFRYIDGYPVTYKDNRFYISFDRVSQNILSYLVIDIIKDVYYHNKFNILCNTCRPVDNWRKDQLVEDNQSYKYNLVDDSFIFDEIKFCNFFDKLYKNIPIMLKKEGNMYIKYDKFNNFYINQVDTIDIKNICKVYYPNMFFIDFEKYNYNIIEDGNLGYSHGNVYPDYIVEQVRLTLLQQGII